MFAVRKKIWLRPTPTSAWPRQTSSRRFSLTGLFGAQSTATIKLHCWARRRSGRWAVQAAQPIFQGGRIRSQYKLAWAQRDEAELTYKKTVNQAFGEVSNSLVGYTSPASTG